METRRTNHVCSGLNAYKYHLVKDITINCNRSGAASQTYTVPNYNNSAAGSYTCMVTVSTVSSSESSSYSLTATGILTFQMIYTIANASEILYAIRGFSHSKASDYPYIVLS